MNKFTYRVSGLHCPSCVLVIEDRLQKEEGVKSANLDLKKETLTLESKDIISINTLNKIFSKNGYKFSNLSQEESNTITLNASNTWWIWALTIIGIFLILSHFGLTGFLNINSSSSLLAIFAFGLIAGFSSCGALLSGIILSAPQNTKKILFGRIISYTLLGGFLGLIGRQFTVSPVFTTVLMILVSAVMVLVALQMLELKFARQISLSLPKTFSKKITQNQMPFVLGLLTVFLPCGFTLLTEGVAILSGSFIRGLLIMSTFVLGSSIPLFLIGLSSDKLIKNQKLIGALILFFVLYNLNFNFGITQKIFSQTNPDTIKTDTPTELKNARLIESVYSTATDMVPNSFTVKKGEPIRFEITVNDNGYGCMSTVMIKGLYNKPQPLIKGKKIVMEFVAAKVGTYQITCAMGVPRGTINVVD